MPVALGGVDAADAGEPASGMHGGVRGLGVQLGEERADGAEHGLGALAGSGAGGIHLTEGVGLRVIHGLVLLVRCGARLRVPPACVGPCLRASFAAAAPVVVRRRLAVLGVGQRGGVALASAPLALLGVGLPAPAAPASVVGVAGGVVRVIRRTVGLRVHGLVLLFAAGILGPSPRPAVREGRKRSSGARAPTSRTRRDHPTPEEIIKQSGVRSRHARPPVRPVVHERRPTQRSDAAFLPGLTAGRRGRSQCQWLRPPSRDCSGRVAPRLPHGALRPFPPVSLLVEVGGAHPRTSQPASSTRTSSRRRGT